MILQFVCLFNDWTIVGLAYFRVVLALMLFSSSLYNPDTVLVERIANKDSADCLFTLLIVSLAIQKRSNLM